LLAAAAAEPLGLATVVVVVLEATGLHREHLGEALLQKPAYR
jgi:hypothetical protein